MKKSGKSKTDDKTTDKIETFCERLADEQIRNDSQKPSFSESYSSLFTKCMNQFPDINTPSEKTHSPK